MVKVVTRVKSFEGLLGEHNHDTLETDVPDFADLRKKADVAALDNIERQLQEKLEETKSRLVAGLERSDKWSEYLSAALDQFKSEVGQSEAKIQNQFLDRVAELSEMVRSGEWRKIAFKELQELGTGMEAALDKRLLEINTSLRSIQNERVAIDLAKSKIESLVAGISSNTATVLDGIEQKIVSSKREIEVLQESLQKERAEADLLRVQVTELRSQTDALRGQVEDLRMKTVGEKEVVAMTVSYQSLLANGFLARLRWLFFGSIR